MIVHRFQALQLARLHVYRVLISKNQTFIFWQKQKQKRNIHNTHQIAHFPFFWCFASGFLVRLVFIYVGGWSCTDLHENTRLHAHECCLNFSISLYLYYFSSDVAGTWCASGSKANPRSLGKGRMEPKSEATTWKVRGLILLLQMPSDFAD